MEEEGEVTHEYKPSGRYDSPLDSKRCKASVPYYGGRRVGFHQCKRKPVWDGWCKQHHPENEAVRRQRSREHAEQRFRRGPYGRLKAAHEEIARLKARIAELEAEGKA